MNRIEGFLKRIGMDPATPVEHTCAFLGRVQTQCVLSIAYENLDILSGKPLSLDRDALYDKIVTRGRGGYCFELNGLLTHMLREMGFPVSERFARFLRGETDVPMRRHRVAIVHFDDADYLCDIGVGQVAPRLPLKLQPGLVQTQNGETYKFERDPQHGWVLYDLHDSAWRQYISFTDDPQYDVDFLQPSFFCEAHPASPFNKKPIIAIKTPDGRRTMDGRVYKVFKGEALVHIEEDISDERMHALLENAFNLTLEA